MYSSLSRDSFLAIAEEAKKQNIPFSGHVPFSVSALEASDTGQKSMEHLFGIHLSCSSREDELRSEMLKVGVNLSGSERIRLEEREALESYDWPGIIADICILSICKEFRHYLITLRCTSP